ncbi:MAG: hypothetical protein Q7S39_02795 [Ignavibacteria bacterium]|nr:hypothetical protein [Ignavibacteria bacterium]
MHIEENLKSELFLGVSKMENEIRQLKKKGYKKLYCDTAELELLNKKKEWLIKEKNIDKLYEVIDKKLKQDLAYIIKKDAWNKIDL